MTIRCAALVLMAACLTSMVASAQEAGNRYRMGHSTHGPAFDEGPRTRPTTLDGIGRTHFPITTRNPEVQAWFDQGHTLLHSYWFYEAERAFRWCLTLEPGNAMAYWGLARASGNRTRAQAFMKKALAGRNSVTPRERADLETWALVDGPDAPDRDKFRRSLEQIVIDFPDDLEAKALYAEASLFSARVIPLRAGGAIAHGPAIWIANPAPRLDALDAAGAPVTLDQFKGSNVLLVFYLGGTCVHCMTQLKKIGDQKDEFGRLDTVLLAVSTDTPEVNAKAQDSFPFRLLFDPTLANTRRFKSYDDFEQMPIHSTLLIDRQGRIHWGRHGGEPFEDVAFLQAQLRRMNTGQRPATAPPTASR